MKYAVIGSRSFNDYELFCAEMSKLKDCTAIISGGARGADKFAEKWAEENKVPIEVVKPDWKQGQGAGLARNRDIIDMCDCVIAFWDCESRGTKSAIDYAYSKNKAVKIIC